MDWASFCGWQVDIGLVFGVAGLIGAIMTIIALLLYIYHRKIDKRAEKIRDIQNQAKFDKILQYVDGLPQAKKGVKEPFEVAKEALADYELDRAMTHLQLALEKADESEQRTALLIIMGHTEFDRGNYDNAMGYFKEALKIAKDSKDIAGQCWALNGLGIADANKGELDKAEKHHREGIDLARGGGFDQSEEALSTHLNNMGLVLRYKGHLEDAFRSHKEALKIDRRIGYTHGEASDLGNIGNILFMQGDLEGALRGYQEALQIDRRIGDPQGEANALGNIGVVLKDKGDLEGALYHHQEALEIERRISNPQGEAIDLGNIGLVLMDKGELEGALCHHQEALEIDRRIGNPQGEAIDLGNIGLVLIDKGDLDSALRHMQQALAIFKKLEMPREINKVENNIKKVKDMMRKK